MKQYKDLLIVGFDAGNYNCKTETECFTSGFKELAPGEGLNFANQLLIDKRRLALSQKRIPLKLDKTEDDAFFNLTLFGIGMEFAHYGVKSGEYSVLPGVALPPGHLAVPGLQERLRSYYKRKVDFTFNGTEYRIIIDKVLVAAQGFAALFAPILSVEMEKLAAENKLLGAVRPFDILVNQPYANVIDLGGGTMDIVHLIKGIPQPSVDLTRDEGIVKAYNEMGAFIRASTGMAVSEEIIDSVIKGEEGVIITDKVRSMIAAGVKRYSQKLLDILYEFDLPFQNSYNMALGGAAIPIAPYWMQSGRFGVLDYLTEIKATAIGLEELAFDFLMKQGV